MSKDPLGFLFQRKSSPLLLGNTAKSFESMGRIHSVFSVLGIQPTRSVSLARGMDQEVYRAKIRTAEHPNSNGSSTAPYSLRTRGEWLNLIQQLNQGED